MSSILVTGGSGQLGSELVSFLLKKQQSVKSPSKTEMDISNEESITNYLHSKEICGIIHCAAWTNVNLAEEKKEDCIRTNATSTKILCDYCSTNDIPLMLISTDYVFDGIGDKPWNINDKVNPLNVYGLSKAMAEKYTSAIKKHYIIRTSWVFGINGKNFIKTIVSSSQNQDTIEVSDDQIGSPTYVVDLVPVMYNIFLSEKYGTYHVCNNGHCSRAELATFVLEEIGSKTSIVSIKTVNSQVKRPLNSRLDTSILTEKGFDLLPYWKDSVRTFLHELKNRC